MSDIEITIDEVPVFVQIAETPLNFAIVIPSPLSILPAAPAQVNVQVVNPPPVQMTVSLESGPPGPPGPPGSTGQRGSLLLGVYGSEGVLPVPTNEGLLVGDYAFDTAGNLYQIES